MTKALVLFHSQQYINTLPMAEAVAEALHETWCEVDMLDTNDGHQTLWSPWGWHSENSDHVR